MCALCPRLLRVSVVLFYFLPSLLLDLFIYALRPSLTFSMVPPIARAPSSSFSMSVSLLSLLIRYPASFVLPLPPPSSHFSSSTLSSHFFLSFAFLLLSITSSASHLHPLAPMSRPLDDLNPSNVSDPLIEDEPKEEKGTHLSSPLLPSLSLSLL